MRPAPKLIGLFGGTFDPVHYGHLHIAQAALQWAGFDQLRLIPCKQSPHRQMPVATEVQRLQMLRLAIKDLPHCVVDTCELERDAPSYTYDTVRIISREHRNSRLCYLLGLDAFQHFNHWFCWQEILERTHLLVIRRPGYAIEHNPETDALYNQHRIDDVQQLRQLPAGGIALIEVDAPAISATEIRRCLRSGCSVDEWIPKAVVDWLKENPVYSLNQVYK